MQAFGRIHKKLAMVYLSQHKYELSEYHFAEVSKIFLDFEYYNNNNNTS